MVSNRSGDQVNACMNFTPLPYYDEFDYIITETVDFEREGAEFAEEICNKTDIGGRIN